MKQVNKRNNSDREILRSRTGWIWEFSKRLVVALALVYFIVIFYAATVMAVTGNLDALTELIQDNADVLKVCVFGYFIKAGVENAFKIGLSKYDTPELPDEPDSEISTGTTAQEEEL